MACADLYTILGVSRSGSLIEAQLAFISKAPSLVESVDDDSFNRLKVALLVISDPFEKKAYDRYGFDGLSDGFKNVFFQELRSFGYDCKFEIDETIKWTCSDSVLAQEEYTSRPTKKLKAVKTASNASKDVDLESSPATLGDHSYTDVSN